MIILEYDFEVVYIPGKPHIVADYLSKDTNTSTAEGIDDSFNEPYIQPAIVDVQKPTDWGRDITQYLTDGA